MTLQDIINEVESSKWQPEFEWVSSIEEVSERINSPHEDYPIGVVPTIQMLRQAKGEQVISWGDACNIQNFLFGAKINTINSHLGSYTSVHSKYHDWLLSLPNRYISVGLREREVKVGEWTPPHPIFLQDLIDKIFPVTLTTQPFLHNRQKQITSVQELITWYKVFQTIHPFEDLNGRVGGIIVAVLSEIDGMFLVPKRFKK